MTKKEKDVKTTRDADIKKKYNINIHRRLIEEKEVFSFLDHISQHTVGRIPEWRDDDNNDFDEPEYLQEEVHPERFLDTVRQFVENCQNGGKISKVEIQGNCDVTFHTVGMRHSSSPAFQIFVTRIIPRFETDAEVMARLRKLEAKNVPVAKKKKTR